LPVKKVVLTLILNFESITGIYFEFFKLVPGAQPLSSLAKSNRMWKYQASNLKNGIYSITTYVKKTGV